jgi:transposase
MTQTSTVTAGIDTSKYKLDIAIHESGQVWQVENTSLGWRCLGAELIKLGVTRVGIEATGGYEKGVVQHLRAIGLTVLVLQPIQVRSYARAHLRRAKNDHLDAVLIAECTAQLIGKPKIAPDPRLTALAGHLTYLEQIEEDIVRYKTRLEHADHPDLRRELLVDIAGRKRRRAALMAYVITALRAHPDLAKRFSLIVSVPGIGERTALALIIRMPELGQLSREEAAALAGLAPYDDDSGKHRGPRHIAGGRARLRRSLYAAALPAAFRWNRALIDLYRRLHAKGRSHKAALIACARKLVVYANTVVARGTPWLETGPAI